MSPKIKLMPFMMFVTIFILSAFLLGCGENGDEITTPSDEDLTSASIQFPIVFPSRLTFQSNITFKATVNASAATAPIVREQTLSITPSPDASYTVIFNELPVGTSQVRLEVISEGYTIFDWEGTVILVAGTPNQRTITLESVLSRQILGSWRLTNTEARGLVALFRPNGTMSLASATGLVALDGDYTVWGNRIEITIFDDIFGEVLDFLSGEARLVGSRLTIVYDQGAEEIYERIDQ